MCISSLHDYANNWKEMLHTTTSDTVGQRWLPVRECQVFVHTADDAPQFGQLAAANLDVQHWSLIWQYVHSVESSTDASSIARQVGRASICHYPVNIELVKTCPNIGINKHQRCFQLMKDFSIDAQTHSHMQGNTGKHGAEEACSAKATMTMTRKTELNAY